jgi:hypothetical protein
MSVCVCVRACVRVCVCVCVCVCVRVWQSPGMGSHKGASLNINAVIPYVMYAHSTIWLMLYTIITSLQANSFLVDIHDHSNLTMIKYATELPTRTAGLQTDTIARVRVSEREDGDIHVKRVSRPDVLRAITPHCDRLQPAQRANTMHALSTISLCGSARGQG